MQHGIKLSVIVPTYNERENLPLLLWLLHKHLQTDPRLSVAAVQQWWEVIVVDDHSGDGTAGVVQALQKADPTGLGCNLVLVQRPGKLGLGTAYSAGLERSRGEWVVLMDADLSHHPRHILQFMRCQVDSGCDIVCGTRYAAGGGVAGWSTTRKITSRGANLLAATLLGASVSDLTGAFRLYRRTCLLHLLSAATCRGYAFQMEVAVHAQQADFRICEVPIVFVDRLYGQSKLGPLEFWGFLKGLLRLLLAT
mmetsp:Transcript_20910/g.35708  ORF Transcript_20910/g.35708 Transcript_20910/m.35708 type:complete len:252 (-) Transcript_20910:985-1740(-)